MAASKIKLDDDQKFALMKFRRNVADIMQPHHDDYFLLRWLRARSWNTEAAEKMLRQSMQWRKEWEVDTIRNWEPPEAVTLFHPSGTSGYDKDGCPVIVIPFAGLDMTGMLHSASRQDLIRSTIQILERNMDLAKETGANQVVGIFDMDNFNIRQYAWRPAAEVVITLLQMYEANYPEILKACFIINAPRVFAIAFNIVKKFLNEYTLGKIQIFKSDPKKWKKAVLENITEDNLPKYYGGTLVDPDGNPKYTTVVKQGGKVPKCYYTKNVVDTEKNEQSFTPVTIKKGDKLELRFIVAEEGCFLRWGFRSEGHDIRFGVTFEDVEGNATPAVRHKRVAAHQMEESGVLACQAPATYTVTFDNTYSILRSKKIHYCVYVTTPLDHISVNQGEEEISSNETEKTNVNGVHSEANGNPSKSVVPPVH